MITVLAGGTGSVKLVRGLAAQENDVCVISNVGDNYWVYGMYVCPDIDTMVYGLADLLDSKRSWGIKNDSFNFLRQMEVFGEETWFRMGDRDAATNLMRTNMLKDGKNLGFITDWLCKKFAVGTKIIPMTDNNVETRITTPKGEMHLQEFWVKHRGKEKVQGIRYVGIEKARPNPEAINAIQNASMVVLAPGNPLTSIGPMLELKGLYKELTKAKKKTVAVSPFIGTDAISGPAAEYMKAAGIEPSALGLSRMYSSVCGHMIIDTKDKKLSTKIREQEMKVYETKITMKTLEAEEALASFMIKQVKI